MVTSFLALPYHTIQNFGILPQNIQTSPPAGRPRNVAFVSLGLYADRHCTVPQVLSWKNRFFRCWAHHSEALLCLAS